ncbi:MAG: glycosyltransferase [Paramuribaculum sp.]|nr:glycosyltransferase [Paramuribaculum sp.]
MSNPKISVVTVTFNSAATLEETILSVINQTYDNIEYIIIDGGSTDGTVDIIKKYSDRITYWISEPDKGIYDAMNKGIHVATGDYINFMNSGDKFFNDSILKKVSDYMVSGEYGVIYGNSISFDGKNRILKVPHPLTCMKTNGCICHQSAFFKNIPTRLYYDLSFNICADYDLFARYYFDYSMPFKYLDLTICFYSFSGISDGNINVILESYDISKRYSTGITHNIRYFFKALSFRVKNSLKRILGDNAISLIRSLKNRKC